MKSSMAITKSAAFRFMLLLHLFLKVKMCVGSVDAVAPGDSDINYDDSDEVLGEVSGGGVGLNRVSGLAGWARQSGLSSTAIPTPSNLMRWEGPAAGRYRMHHVRHEQHYLKHRPAKVPNPSESTLVALDQGGPYQAHTVTTTTVTGAGQQKSHHHSHQHHQQQQHHRPHSQHHGHHYKHHRKVVSDDDSEEEVSLIRSSAGASYERRHLFEQGSFKDAWDSMSIPMRDVHERQVANNRKRSASSFHPLASNALPDVGPRSSRVVSSREHSSKQQPSQQSINPGSKNYFEQLLNNYKSSAPYYKELHQSPKTPQTKALPPGSRRNQRSSAEVTKSKASQQQQQQQQTLDADLDYYDDEAEENVQNDAPSVGGVMSTSARAPTSTTTTTTTTTPRSILSGLDSEEASGSDGSSAGSETDTSYSSYYQKMYAMPANPRRNGNNRYNSITRTPSSAATVNHHRERLHLDRIDPAKQVSYPSKYSSLTDYKQANFGTKDAVERSYHAYNPQYERAQAKQHMERMIRDGICKVPKAKIVPASKDRTKMFTPQCTILHRCEDDTGCCGPTQTCAPKASHEVQLYFYVSSDSYVQNVGQRQQNTIALTFTNHTECHCVDRTPSSRTPNQNSLENSAEGSGGSSGMSSSSSCTCPRHFKSVIDSESQCYCDCVSSDRDCIRFKEGFESFSIETRKCIRSRKCKVPRCEYGLYNRDEGRCPKKSDLFKEHFSQFR